MKRNFWNMTLLGIGALMVSIAAGNAQHNCAPRAEVLEHLTARYGETRQSVGLTRNNMVFEVFASAHSSTWTITVTNTSGQTCLVAAGHAFETLSEAGPNTDPDA